MAIDYNMYYRCNECGAKKPKILNDNWCDDCKKKMRSRPHGNWKQIRARRLEREMMIRA